MQEDAVSIPFVVGLTTYCLLLLAVHIKNFEEFFFDEISASYLFYQIMLQAEFNDFFFFVVLKHLSFHLLRIEFMLYLIMFLLTRLYIKLWCYYDKLKKQVCTSEEYILVPLRLNENRYFPV